MQHELKEMQPVLAATAEQVEGMMTTIAHDKEEAAATRLQVGRGCQGARRVGIFFAPRRVSLAATAAGGRGALWT